MDEQKECDMTRNHVHQSLSTMKVVEEQYQRERSCINKELAQQKAHEDEINQKLIRFSFLDMQLEWKMSEIQGLQRCCEDYKVTSSLREPKTSGLLCLDEKDVKTAGLKRCQKRLIKKGRMDTEFLELVQEAHLSSMKSDSYCGIHELNNMMESMVQRIHHGNKKGADEMKIYRELSNFKETKESYVEPEPWYPRERRSKQVTDRKRSMQHHLNVGLDVIEKLKREQIRRIARVKRLKAELGYVRKNINWLNKKLENVDSKILKANKRSFLV